MIDERRIDDKAKYGTQYDVGNITLYVTTEFWGGRWHKPTIQLMTVAENAAPSMRHLIRDRVTELMYETLLDLEIVFQEARKEWDQLADWRLKKNREISKKTLGAS